MPKPRALAPPPQDLGELAHSIVAKATDMVWPPEMQSKLWDGQPPHASWDPAMQHIKRLANDIVASDTRRAERVAVQRRLVAEMEGASKEKVQIRTAEGEVYSDPYSYKLGLYQALQAENAAELTHRAKMIDAITNLINRTHDRKQQFISQMIDAWDVQQRSLSGEKPTAPSMEELMQLAAEDAA